MRKWCVSVWLHGYLGGNVRPRVVAYELKIFVAEVENAFYIGIDVHLGQRTGRTAELQTGLIEVVQVKMGVAGGVNKFAGLQISYLGHHLQQKGIAGYVEGYAEEGIGRTLIKLK